MNRPTNGWARPSGSPGMQKSQARKFVPATRMPSSQTFIDKRRQNLDLEHVYLSDPPEGTKLFEARLAIAGHHLVPAGLTREVLDDICLKNKVWVERATETAIDVKSETIPKLRQAMKELHWLLHNLRVRKGPAYALKEDIAAQDGDDIAQAPLGD